MARLGSWKWILAVVLSMWSSIGLAVDLLILLMGLDFLTGICCAARKGKLSSHVSWRGLMKKSAVLIVVLVSHLIQRAIELGNGVHFIVSLGQAVALAYCWNEVISILENCVCMGAPLPDLVQKIMAAAPKMQSADEEQTLS